MVYRSTLRFANVVLFVALLLLLPRGGEGALRLFGIRIGGLRRAHLSRLKLLSKSADLFSSSWRPDSCSLFDSATAEARGLIKRDGNCVGCADPLRWLRGDSDGLRARIRSLDEELGKLHMDHGTQLHLLLRLSLNTEHTRMHSREC